MGLEPGPCIGGGECRENAARLCWALPDRPALVEVTRCAETTAGNSACYLVSGHDVGETFPMCGAGRCSADSCDEDVLVECINGVARRFDCAGTGKRCIQQQAAAFCGFETECSESRCEGNSAVLCENGHVIFRQPCADILPEASCVGRGTSVTCGAPADSGGCDVSPDALSEECIDQTRARVCYQGVWVEVDCGVVGGECNFNEQRVTCTVPRAPIE